MPAQDYLTCVDNLKARKLPAGRVQAMLGDVDKFGDQAGANFTSRVACAVFPCEGWVPCQGDPSHGKRKHSCLLAIFEKIKYKVVSREYKI